MVVDIVNICLVTLHALMTLADEFLSINLGDMNTIKCDILSISANVSARMPSALDNQNFGNGIFCLASGVLLRTAHSVTHVVSWTFTLVLILFTTMKKLYEII